jgi:hypothetical protein
MLRPSERTAVLVIRAWLEEENAANPLRFRITSTLDVSAPQARETSLAASEEDVVTAVRMASRLRLRGVTRW